MVDRARLLKTPYGGYHHRHVPKEDADLTHVGPNTPCGEYLRRFWQPVCYADDIKDLPLAIKLLGEELVVFRDGSGAIGLLERHCPHRGTSLEFGLVGEKGIRCCYHGWLFDVDGGILETPGEPADSTLKHKLCHGAYPVHEAHGMIFAYMGPPERMPPFPAYDSFHWPGYRATPGRKYFYPCNWLQILETTMDPVHAAFLHQIVSGAVFTDRFGVLPELDFAETPVGMIYVATTRRDGDTVCSRMLENVLPTLQQVAPIAALLPDGLSVSGPGLCRWITPVDDTNTMIIELRHVSDGVTPAWWGDRNFMIPNQLAADSYEQGQRKPGDFEAQVSQRPIAIHALEHLGTTDRGVTMLRNQLRRGIRAVKAGGDPVGISRDGGAIIPTYSNATIQRLPPAETPELDKRLLREAGRQLLERYLKIPPLTAAAEQVPAPGSSEDLATVPGE